MTWCFRDNHSKIVTWEFKVTELLNLAVASMLALAEIVSPKLIMLGKTIGS